MCRKKILSTLAALASVTFFFAPATLQATIILTEDFESPDVTAAQSDGNTSGAIPTGWVGATQGFGATRRGIVDEAHGDFTDPVGEQAFAFRYTNSGLTTAEGEIGVLTLGATYTVLFDVVLDGHNSTTPYNAYLAAFDAGATTRNDVRSDTNQRTILTSTSGNATNDGLYTQVSFSYTVDGTTPVGLLGKDVGLVFRGASSSAIIDNVSVDVVTAIPEPATLALLGLGGLAMLVRRRLD
jgi:hypothetical protein